MKKCVFILLQGTVQGVGMRPFLHRLAEECRLYGQVRNSAKGVELTLEGEEKDLERFQQKLLTDPPPLAVITAIQVLPQTERKGFQDFCILESSQEGNPQALIPPDLAPCKACEQELFQPKDRRFRYPFINCTDCGPRFTIIKGLPYDRKRTSMAAFPMCPACKAEYQDIRSRRYHAQPNCCPDCGPQVSFADERGGAVKGDPFCLAQKALSQGKILAIKGIGGFHLACDARNSEAVRRLRKRKNREEKPLALMSASAACAESICRISPQEKSLLESRRRPILLLEKLDRRSFQEISINNRLGIMLPYSPLHLLLLDQSFGGPDLVVMTSANSSDCPVIIHEAQALEQLMGTADGFLLHNRPIEQRCDDSLAMEWQGREYFFRRSRGYCPQPILLPWDVSGILAFGAEQKASFAMGREKEAFLSQHIGDLKNVETMEHYQEAMDSFMHLFGFRPGFLACDLHPDYSSTALAREMSQKNGLPLLPIQHHWAHMASCMADNGLDELTFGIIWDGTGLGEEPTSKEKPAIIWGAEFLKGNYSSFRRLGSIRPLALLGGDQAIRHIGRIALALTEDAKSTCALPDLSSLSFTSTPQEKAFLLSMLQKGVCCIPASSMGRLFDGVDAILEGRLQTSYEGQGASCLEALGESCPDRSFSPYPLTFYQEEGIRRFDTRPLIASILQDLLEGKAPSVIARKFMDTLSAMALDQCLALNPERLPVVLSGGVFQNRYLLETVSRLLAQAGFRLYCHRQVSPNDQGIPLGQMAIAQRSEAYHVSCSSFKNSGN